MKKKVTLILKPKSKPDRSYSFWYHDFVLNVDLEILKALSRGDYDFETNVIDVISDLYGEAERILNEYVDKHFPDEQQIAKEEESREVLD